MPKVLSMRLFSFAFLFISAILLLSAPQAYSQVYHWTDDQGRRNFTDDLSNVPLKYQRNMGKMFSPAPARIKKPEQEEPKEEKKEPPFSRSSAEEEPKLTAEETSAINEALGFLNADIARYTPYIDKPLDLNIDQVVRGALDQKIALAEKLSAFELEALKETGNFLKASAKKDEDVRRLSPNTNIRKDRAVKRRDRAKAEEETKTALIKKLKEALAPPEKADEK